MDDAFLEPREPDATASLTEPRDGERSRGAASDPSPGDVVASKYRLEEKLGAGGMGVVFAAKHLVLRERVAIKLMRGATARRPESVARFMREARSIARMKSEHFARAIDVGTLEDGTPFLVMDCLEGEDLRAILRRRGSIPPAEAIEHLLAACEAMADAHKLGIVHRDLKPSNLFIAKTKDGGESLKVLDFGVAKLLDGSEADDLETLAESTCLLGTPAYMSPEQIRSVASVDERSDVWSLGVILHELIAGTPPFIANNSSALLAVIAADPPRSFEAACPSAPARLGPLLRRCLEKDVSRRISSVNELARELGEIARTSKDGAGRGRSRGLLFLAAAAAIAIPTSFIALARPRSPSPVPVAETPSAIAIAPSAAPSESAATMAAPANVVAGVASAPLPNAPSRSPLVGNLAKRAVAPVANGAIEAIEAPVASAAVRLPAPAQSAASPSVEAAIAHRN